MKIGCLLLGVLLATACTNSPSDTEKNEAKPIINFGKLPTFTENREIQAVVEIPVGTTAKREYNYDHNNFPIDIKNGKPRYVDFLGYVGNYGFIPSTFMDPSQGGDGDALDVLIIGKPAKVGDVMKITPIAIIQLLDNGEIDDKLLAIPCIDSLQTIKANSLAILEKDYPAAKQIIETWYANYKGIGQMEVVGWQDETAAIAAIKKWQIK